MIFLELFWSFFKIGVFTFGGGYAMLPLIQEEVFSRNWMDMPSLLNFVAVSESTPGPFAVNVATFIGMKVAGVPGSICATIGVILPSFFIILIVAKCYENWKNSRTVKGLMSGLKPAVVGLICAAAISVFQTVFVPNGFNVSIFSDFSFYMSIIIFLVSVFMAFKKLHPIIIISVSAVLGIIYGIFQNPGLFSL